MDVMLSDAGLTMSSREIAELVESRHSDVVRSIERLMQSETIWNGYAPTAYTNQQNRIMYRLNGEWIEYQQHIDAGRFEVKTGKSDGGHAFNRCMFTPKGVEWIAGEWAKRQIRHDLSGFESAPHQGEIT